jgi:hypothetical protein
VGPNAKLSNRLLRPGSAAAPDRLSRGGLLRRVYMPANTAAEAERFLHQLSASVKLLK